jgi:hypothetical protein
MLEFRSEQKAVRRARRNYPKTDAILLARFSKSAVKDEWPNTLSASKGNR